ncbi:pescadillo-like protein, partial [Leptotrombidium deliense]
FNSAQVSALMAGNKKTKKHGKPKAFITRRKAMQKLQVSLKDFRRLCILKGIYPVEPKNRNKMNGGSSQSKTFYLLSDIQYLAHEPILWKLWDFKIFMRRMAKAKGKRDYETVDLIQKNKPFYKLDHIVAERYPRFIDALRDVDDALSMCFLYSRFSKTSLLPLELIEVSRKLSVEFMHYVIEVKALRKVFVSIKGYYYQVEIKGQTITWVVPHNFNVGRYHDVDFKVMTTFNEFYVHLVGFVIYRLYSEANLYYPPKISAATDNNVDCGDEYFEEIAALNTPIVKKNISVEEDVNFDTFNEPELNGNNSLSFHELIKFQKLFDGLKFFLSREVPRESLVFVIRSFGGLTSWDSLYPGATYSEDDESITHQIVDRDNVANKYITRYYVQPQWIFDCVNARRLLPVENYFVGVTLPPHLSPFVEEKEGEYVPPEKVALRDGKSMIIRPDEEVASNEIAEVPNEDDKSHMVVKAGKIATEKKVSVDREERKLAEMMIPKKKKRLYDKILFAKKRQMKEVNRLKEKRKVIDGSLRK